jgi:uncharacterized protein YcbK (DUF882 family)
MRAAALAIPAVAIALLLPVTPARADEELAKKDAYLAAKDGRAQTAEAKAAWQKQLDARIGKPPPALINIYNHWTKEFLAVPAEGEVAITQDDVYEFFRCRFTNHEAEMDARLLSVLVDGARHFEKNRVNVVSGHRSEKYNLILQKKGRNVSRNSQHVQGTAVDFRIPGVSIERLHRWVRSLRLGGVGFYTHSRFIHADTGRVRYWTAR